MQIKAFTEKYHITSDTARFYEAEGLLKPARSSGGYRIYDEQCEKTIKYIIVLKQIGFSLQEIRYLLTLEQQPISQACNIASVAAFNQKIEDIERKIKFYQTALHVLQSAGSYMEQGKFAENQDKIDKLVDDMFSSLNEKKQG